MFVQGIYVLARYQYVLARYQYVLARYQYVLARYQYVLHVLLTLEPLMTRKVG